MNVSVGGANFEGAVCTLGPSAGLGKKNPRGKVALENGVKCGGYSKSENCVQTFIPPNLPHQGAHTE